MNTSQGLDHWGHAAFTVIGEIHLSDFQLVLVKSRLGSFSMFVVFTPWHGALLEVGSIEPYGVTQDVRAYLLWSKMVLRASSGNPSINFVHYHIFKGGGLCGGR